MRIIAGKFKRLSIAAVPGHSTRPTTDFMKEVIFSVLDSCTGKQVLDLYSGSGNLALEALSRGADSAHMVDMSEKAIKTMKRNIANLDCSQQCRIHRKRVSSFISHCTEQFDLIFMDPPYQKNLVNSTLENLISAEIIKPGGTIVIEHAPKEALDEKWADLIRYTKRTHTTQISILQLEEK